MITLIIYLIFSYIFVTFTVRHSKATQNVFKSFLPKFCWILFSPITFPIMLANLLADYIDSNYE